VCAYNTLTNAFRTKGTFIDQLIFIIAANLLFPSFHFSSVLFYGAGSIMKIIAQSLSRKTETNEEEYAARKLLDVLRNARLREREREESEAKTEEYRSEWPSSTDVYDPSTVNESAENISMDIDLINDKRTIRDSLERLISLYLTKLREDSIEYNFDDNHVRGRRDLSSVKERISRRKKLVPGDCKVMDRKIKTLDRVEIERALRNLTSTEFNIRKLLNYRSVLRCGHKFQFFVTEIYDDKNHNFPLPSHSPLGVPERITARSYFLMTTRTQRSGRTEQFI
jgi:hypothetical protein